MKDYDQCSVCSSRNLKKIKKEYPVLVKCRECDYTTRLINPTGQGYDLDYDKVSEDWKNGRRAVYKPFIKELEAFRKTNRILDVGAGPGFFVRDMGERGWESYGIEIAKSAARYAREQLKVNVTDIPLEESGLEKGSFDIVTYWNVLDSIPDMKKILKCTKDCLRTGGAVYIRSPNSDFHIPLDRMVGTLRKLGLYTSSPNPAQLSLNMFNEKCLERLLSDSGFEGIKSSNTPLVWTTQTHHESSLKRQILKEIVSWTTNGVGYLSSDKILLSPAIITRAIKP